jgi:hypothetical protein
MDVIDRFERILDCASVAVRPAFRFPPVRRAMMRNAYG